MDGDRHVGAPRRLFGGGHGELEVVMLEVRFGQAQDHRRAAVLRGVEDRLEEIETHQIEAAHRVAVAVGMVQHVTHVHQRHGSS